MFYRQILAELEAWAASEFRKVLILRGARQVGKTTAVRMFSKSFDVFIELNLEIPADLQIFDNYPDIRSLYNLILLRKQVKPGGKRILLFIDEIQNSATALKSLRFFHEQLPEICVIAAGSILEIYLFREKLEISVGRVEYKWVYPMNFEEYLMAAGATDLLELMRQQPFPDYAYPVMRDHFVHYALVGGMPEAVTIWLKTQNIILVQDCLRSMFLSYQDDILKYAQTSDQASVLRHLFETAFREVGKQISFEGFGQSSYKSQAIKNAFQIMVNSALFTLIYPYTSAILPTIPNKTKRPKLLLLDTGLLNYQSHVMEEYFQTDSLNSVFKGAAMENLIGQILTSIKAQYRFELAFWKRGARNASSEVDYVLVYKGMMIPIEVKAGKTGSLKSLMMFMNESPLRLAVRIYDGPSNWEKLISPNGNEFWLLNLHLGLSSKVCDYIDLKLQSIQAADIS